MTRAILVAGLVAALGSAGPSHSPALASAAIPRVVSVAASPLRPDAGTTPKATIWDGVYTKEQAARGADAYQQACAACHQEDLLGDAGIPALVGEAFFERWTGSTVDDVLRTTRRTMPMEAPDSLGTQVYVDIISHLLAANGSPAAAAELPVEGEKLQQIVMTRR